MANVRPLPKELQEKAIKELKEDVARVPKDIQAIKDWLKQKPYIKSRTDDQFILTFLRGCKFSLERTKEKLETYHTLKTLVPEMCKNRNPFDPEMQEILKLGVMLPLPNTKDITMPRAFIFRNGCYDPARYKIEDLFKVNLMVQQISWMEDDQIIVAGMQGINDMKDITLAHIANAFTMKKGMKMFQDGFPIRPKHIHMLNVPSFYSTIFAIMSTILNEKMKSRIRVYDMNNLDEFYKCVPKEILPKEYGGNGPTIQELTDTWKAKVESYASWFAEDDKYCTDEKKRPGKPKTSREFFGIEGAEGSFRKLDVD